MNSRRFNVCSAALVVLFVMGGQAMAQPATQPGSSSSDIELDVDTL